MNKKGNIIINLMAFIFAIGFLIVFISPMRSMINIAQGSDFLNCEGYIDESATGVNNQSYDITRNTDTLSCLTLKLYIPYLLVFFLIYGVARILMNSSTDYIGITDNTQQV